MAVSEKLKVEIVGVAVLVWIAFVLSWIAMVLTTASIDFVKMLVWVRSIAEKMP